ncbi:MAG: hypothetical protein V2I54_04570 [Bacteroidales bacterium]|jgi:hypothetical protein|nr:hypothetical protein [Bacteroidales bacterium]
MKPETINQMMDLLKKDKLIFNKNFSVEDLSAELVAKLQKKIKREHQIIRWVLGVSLFFVFLTFFSLELTLNRSAKFTGYLVRFWYFLLPMLMIIVFVSKYSWNAKRNLLILDLFEKEMITETV